MPAWLSVLLLAIPLIWLLVCGLSLLVFHFCDGRCAVTFPLAAPLFGAWLLLNGWIEEIQVQFVVGIAIIGVTAFLLAIHFLLGPLGRRKRSGKDAGADAGLTMGAAGSALAPGESGRSAEKTSADGGADLETGDPGLDL